MAIKAVLFDFDGTLSTLRAGWEEIMAPFMVECIAGNRALSAEEKAAVNEEVARYIDESTGIQTIYQMRWLAETVRNRGWNPEALDEWEYKAEYNRRLLADVERRIEKLKRGELDSDVFLMKGAADFVKELHRRGIELYVASGTDHPDVVREAEVLGLASYFKMIVGAPVGKADCSKAKVIGDLLRDKGFLGEELAVIGDGKVEIRLGKDAGGLALGLASDENRREGVNPVKESRLSAAGAAWIAGDFGDPDEWFARMGL